MTEAKKLKQTIRARSRKTGESYTAARRQVLSARAAHAAPKVAARGRRSPAAEEPKTSPARPAMTDTAVAKKTGHGYDHWFAVLDTFGARGKGHAAAAAHLHADHGVPGWHSQMITVAYERVRGIRAVNQSCAGDFQVSVSKTVSASVSAVVSAFSVGSQRASWLKASDAGLVRALTAALSGPKGKPVTVKDARNARLRYAWNDTKVEIRITATPKGNATVVADNTQLEGTSAVAERRALWRVALEGLKTHFTA